MNDLEPEFDAESYVERVRIAAYKATPGPWSVDSSKMEDTPEKYEEYVMVTESGATLFDTTNSSAEVGLIQIEHDVDGSHAWNDISKKNMAYIELVQPSNILKLLSSVVVSTGEETTFDEGARAAAINMLSRTEPRDFLPTLVS